MNVSRVAAWIIGAAVFGAWLASAAGVTRQGRVAQATPRPADAVQFDALAADVQAQAGRLRERLAQAPAPRATDRNPFQFSMRAEPRPTVSVVAPTVTPDDPIRPDVREPVLELVGIAESGAAAGIVRTAMITGGPGELMMVTAGQRILGRYDVTLVGHEAVELKDIETGGVRRLVLR